MKKIIIGSLVFLFTLLLAACGSDEKKDIKDTNTDSLVDITEEEKVDNDHVVAVINGDDVTGITYNLVYTQLKLHAEQIGKEMDTEEIKNATMDSIIDRQLLFQQAKEQGIEVTNENAAEEFETIKKESEKELSTLLEQYQITEDGFKEQLKFELTMNEYMAKVIDVSVTEEELKDYYEKAKEGSDEIPAYDEVKDQLKKQLLNEKTQEQLQANIDEVKEKAKIEKKI